MQHSVHVYRSDLGDCSLNGISAQASSLRVIELGDPMPKDSHVERLNYPVAILMAGNVPGAVKLVKAGPDGQPAKGWAMFGGNFAFSSDSRWRDAVSRIAGSPQSGPVPIHDRYE